MAYGSKAIANLLIDVARENGASLDQMKLQKLTYISHGWNLAISGTPLISDQIQAWQYGPVIPVLYDEFKNCGRSAITDHATDYKIDANSLNVTLVPPTVKKDDATTRALIEQVWKVYGEFSGPQLSNLTHMIGTPWDATYSTSPKAEICNDLIKGHFIQLSKQRNGQ